MLATGLAGALACGVLLPLGAAAAGGLILDRTSGYPGASFVATYSVTATNTCFPNADFWWDGYPNGPTAADSRYLGSTSATVGASGGCQYQPATLNAPADASVPCDQPHTVYAFQNSKANSPPADQSTVASAVYTLNCAGTLTLGSSSGPPGQPVNGTYTYNASNASPGSCADTGATVDFEWNGVVAQTATLDRTCTTPGQDVAPANPACGMYSVVAYIAGNKPKTYSQTVPYSVTCPTPTPTPAASATPTTTPSPAQTSSTPTTTGSSPPSPSPSPHPTASGIALLVPTPTPSPGSTSTPTSSSSASAPSSSPTPTPQTANPGPTPVPGTGAGAGPTRPSGGSGPIRSGFVRSLVDPRHINTDPGRIGFDLLLALALILVIVFPCELFNGTLEENYDEVRGWFARPFGWLHRVRGALPGLPGWTIFPFFAVVMAGLYGLLDPRFGFDETSLLLFLGLLAGLTVVTLGFDLPSMLHVRVLRGERVELTPYAGTLIVAGVCVLISRLAHFQPGYLYGLVAGFSFAGRLNRRDEGRALAISAGSVFILSLVAYVLWVPVKDAAEQPDPAALALVLDAMLATVFIAGLETAMFGLIPVRFLDGSKVIAWDRRGWALLMGLGLFGFIHVLLDPRAGFIGWRDDTSAVTVFALFAGFGTFSVAFWGYFRLRHRGEEEDHHRPEDPQPPAEPGLSPVPPSAL